MDTVQAAAHAPLDSMKDSTDDGVSFGSASRMMITGAGFLTLTAAIVIRRAILSIPSDTTVPAVVVMCVILATVLLIHFGMMYLAAIRMSMPSQYICFTTVVQSGTFFMAGAVSQEGMHTSNTTTDDCICFTTVVQASMFFMAGVVSHAQMRTSNVTTDGIVIDVINVCICVGFLNLTPWTNPAAAGIERDSEEDSANFRAACDESLRQYAYMPTPVSDHVGFGHTAIADTSFGGSNSGSMRNVFHYDPSMATSPIHNRFGPEPQRGRQPSSNEHVVEAMVHAPQSPSFEYV